MAELNKFALVVSEKRFQVSLSVPIYYELFDDEGKIHRTGYGYHISDTERGANINRKYYPLVEKEYAII